ncbi:twin-arginine translocation signal domain-containing protein [Halobacteriaceae archaeon GCM10025711]
MRGRDAGISRRDFVKAAVAIGGASALAACVEREGEVDVPTGPDDPSTLPERQHAWNAFLATDDHGNDVPPRHHVVLLLDYAGPGTPDDADRDAVETALRSLERSYRRGNDGLLFTMGYAPAYFDRFDESLPDSVDLPAPTALSPFEQPDLDTPDAVLHLASDHGQVLLAAEEALFGEREGANGVSFEASLGDVFDRADRRTGFIGSGLPASHQDVSGIPEDHPVPEDAPLYMGFKAGFKRNQASETRVTIPDGPFAEGTTQHLSKLDLRLHDWYGEQEYDERVAEIFCPAHAAEGRVEGVGENLGDSSGVQDGCPEHVEDHANEYGRVGHAQKAATVREDDSPLILRRDFDSTDGDRAGLHFLALQRGVADFAATKQALNATDLVERNPAIRQRVNNGILEYTFVKRRGNYLLPPRRHRALPAPRPE